MIVILQYARKIELHTRAYEGKHIFCLPKLAENCFGYSPEELFLVMPIQSQLKNWMEAVVKKKLEERFMMVLNEDLHSPLTLAAAMPDPRDFDGADEAATSPDAAWITAIKEETVPDKEKKETKKKTMLRFLLQKLHSLRWEYGPVKRNLVDLAGVEMSFDKYKYPRLKEMLEAGYKTPTMKVIRGRSFKLC